LFGSGAVLNVTTNWTLHVAATTQQTAIKDFKSGHATYWDVTNIAQFQVFKNSNNVNVVYNNTVTNMNTSIPPGLDILYKGEYTPGQQLTPNVDNNNTSNVFCKIIRTGYIKIYCNAPGFSWISSSDQVNGTLNATFLPL
jgi:hypothetical protein